MTVYGYPPAVRVEPAPSPSIYSGLPVSASQTWAPMAYGANWLNGYGACLIPYTAYPGSGNNEVASGGTATWRFQTYTRSQAIERIWVAQVVGRTTEKNGTAQLYAGSGTPTEVYVSPTGEINQTIFYREILGSQSAAQTELTFTMNAFASHVTLQSLACWEQWRPVLLQSADDHGVNTQSDIARERIYTGNVLSGVAESVTGTYFATEYADARRTGQFCFAVPTNNPYVISSSTYQPIIDVASPLLTRKLNSGQTTGKLYWSALVKVNDSGPGYIRLTTSHSGVSSVVTFTNNLSLAWTTPEQIDVDCDDMTSVDGRQSSTWDDMNLEVKSDFALDVSIASVCVWEQPP